MRKLQPGRLVIASHNEGKVREIRDLLGPLWDRAGLGRPSSTCPSPTRSATTFIDNADLKAREAADLSGLPALADDSGLCVEALEGRPGIFSARWALAADPRVAPVAGPGEVEGPRDFGLAMRRVWEELEARGTGSEPQRPFRLRPRRLLARRAQRMVRGPGRGDTGLAAARRQRLRLRPDLRARRRRQSPSARWTRPRSTGSATARTPSASWWRRFSSWTRRPPSSRRKPGPRRRPVETSRPEVPAFAGMTDDGPSSGVGPRPLHPLAVLRLQMPLLRLQQPCPRVGRPGAVARRSARGPGLGGAGLSRPAARPRSSSAAARPR